MVDAPDHGLPGRDSEESLSYFLGFEELVTSISTQLINLSSTDIDSVIDDALKRLGEFTGVDRSYVFLLSKENQTMTNTHEWCAPGIEPQIDNLQNLPTSMLPWLMERLRRLESIPIIRVADLPEAASAEKEIFESQDIRSIILVPMTFEGRLYGFLGLDAVRSSKQWPERTIGLLRIVGEMIINSLERKRTEEVLRESEKRHRLLFERNLAGVYRNTIDGKILDCNDACARILGYGHRDELMGIDAIDVYYDPSDRDQYIEDLLERGVVTNTEVCLKRKDGSPVWVLENATLLDTTEEGVPTVEGTLIDISEIKRAEALLQESEERYRLMAQYSTDMIARLTPDWIFMYVSPASSSIVGYTPAELIGRSIEELIHPDDREAIRDLRKSIVEKEDVFTVSYRIRRANGKHVWLESTCRPILGPDGTEVLEIISVSRDISERKEVQARVEYQAYHDPLTSLPNRMLFLDRLSVSLSHANRTGRPVAVMFFDLDNFKFINDTLGHSVGDALLQGVARRLRSITRGEDTVSRMGGDEFTLISQVQNVDDASRIAEKILEVIARPFEIEGQEIYVTTSIGIAIYPNDGEDEDTLLKSADGAMYRAKSSGRNNYQLCTAEMNEKAMERLTLERDLRGALERDELALHYQPQVDLNDGTVIGLEALLRWSHPERGPIPPGSFIQVAENSRLIFDIGEWVLHTACAQVRDWQIAGLGKLRLSVNLSARQFQHRGLVSAVAGILDRTALMPDLLELEITESIVMQNTEWSVKMIQEFRNMGLRISMDDFGTGYSSLNYLKLFRIDTLKIDRNFLLDVPGTKSSATIVSAMIRMAKGLDMNVIAEGVETEIQREFLRREGCDAMQGFLFSEPLPAGEVSAFLRDYQEAGGTR